MINCLSSQLFNVSLKCTFLVNRVGNCSHITAKGPVNQQLSQMGHLQMLPRPGNPTCIHGQRDTPEVVIKRAKVPVKYRVRV